jgi:hypothetical protein
MADAHMAERVDDAFAGQNPVGSDELGQGLRIHAGIVLHML